MIASIALVSIFLTLGGGGDASWNSSSEGNGINIGVTVDGWESLGSNGGGNTQVSNPMPKPTTPPPPPLTCTVPSADMGTPTTQVDTNDPTSGTQLANCQPNEPAEPIVVTAEDFRRINLDGSGITINPENKDAVINLPLVAYTSADSQRTTITLLGTRVLVEATPIDYTWNWGDGSKPTSTEDPGRPYPSFDISHTYTATGTHSIALTTTWSGRFSINGGNTWQSINGTATTTDTAPPLTVVEKLPVLID